MKMQGSFLCGAVQHMRRGFSALPCGFRMICAERLHLRGFQPLPISSRRR